MPGRPGESAQAFEEGFHDQGPPSNPSSDVLSQGPTTMPSYRRTMMAPETHNPSNDTEHATTLGFPALDALAPHAHWLVRLVLASIFVFHGIGKFPAAEAMAAMMGMPVVMIVMLGVMELGAAALVLLGGLGQDWATRLGGLLLAGIMAGAIVLVHAPRWSFVATEEFPMGGMEFQVLIALIGLFLAVRGNAFGDAA